MKKIIKIIIACIVCLLITNTTTFIATVWLTSLPEGCTRCSIIYIGFDVNNTTVEVNNPLMFNASKTFYSGPGLPENIPYYAKDLPSLFLWDFDDSDGFQIDAEGVVVNHTYIEPGTYNVTLMVVIYPASDGSSSVRYVGTSKRTITVVE